MLECSENDPNACAKCHRYFSVSYCIQKGYIEGVDGEVYEQAINCEKCGGLKQKGRIERQRVHDYFIGKYQNDLDRFAESEKLKSLRGEIGLVRMLIQNILTTCQNSQDLLFNAQRLDTLIARCEKLVGTCDKIERQDGMYIDHATAIQFAVAIVSIISQHINDKEIINIITTQVGIELEKLGKDTDDAINSNTTRSIAYST